MRNKRFATGIAVALLFAVVVAVVVWPSPLDLSDSRWIPAAMRRHLRFQDIDHRLNAVYRTLPGESRYELLYSSRQDVLETRNFYERQLADAKDEAGGVAAIKLEGIRLGRKCTVRNYYSEIADVYCVTLEASEDEAQAIVLALESLPESKLFSDTGPLAAITLLQQYGGFVLYSLEPLNTAMPLDKPVVSRAYIAPDDSLESDKLLARLVADAGLKRGEMTLTGTVDGFGVVVSPMKTETGTDLLTVRIQKIRKGEN